jgi:nucleotide-binding universal stress UspA family protein
MAIKDLLVHLDASARSNTRLDLARDLAIRHAAVLTALYVIDIQMPHFAYVNAGFADAAVLNDMIGRARAAAISSATRVEQGFRERVRRNGLVVEWRLVEGLSAQAIAVQARSADLTIVGQHNPDDAAPPGGADVPVATLLSSGRPVLVVPYAGTPTPIGNVVLVGWKSSREAARAVNDAIPLLLAARRVIVLAINAEHGSAAEGEVRAADIVRHLARHGINAEASEPVVSDVPEGEVLLNYASDLGADLIVAGGYGHSRTRELLFGGVTRTLLTAMTVPVLLSH